MKKIAALSTVPAAFKAIADKVNELVRKVGPLANLSGANGITITKADNNVIIGLTQGATGSASTLPAPVTSGTYPLQCYDAGGGNFNMYSGTVNKLVATFGADEPYANAIVYLDVTVNDSTGEATAVSVSIAGSVPADTDTHAYVPVATITSGGGITNYRVGSLWHIVCGGLHKFNLA